MDLELDDAVRLRRRAAFDRQAERYAAYRPTYPDAVFDRLAAYGDLAPGARVLEAAPGPGQATVSMAARGWTVTAVELGPELAAYARRRVAAYPQVEVVVGAFEDWRPPAEPYDAFLCATAWHWLDPATRLPRIAAALRPGGTAAVVWTHHVAGGTKDFFAEVQGSYLRWDPGARPDERLPDEHDLAPSTAELLASELFGDVESHAFAAEIRYAAEDYVRLLSTYSPTLALPDGDRAALLGEIAELINRRYGGSVTKRYLFELVLARRPTDLSEAQHARAS